MRFGLRNNNKGNTLAVVLVGIFILSILGTLILGVTATNYKMKVNEKKSEDSFYYAERAIDDIYAGIGNDVMTSIKDSYTDILETYVSSGATVDKTIANDNFKTGIRTKLTGLYKTSDIEIPNMLSEFKNDINVVSGYKYDVYSPSTSPVSVKYYKKELDPTGAEIDVELGVGDSTNLISKIVIQNVGVSCQSDRGYLTKIITDFEVSVPNVNVDFTDSQTSTSLESLCQYTLISQGYNLQPDIVTSLNRDFSAIKVNDNVQASITGNIYAGGVVYNAIQKTTPAGKIYYVNDTTVLKKLPSIELGDNVKLDIKAKIVNCETDFVLENNSDAKLRNLAGEDDSVDDYTSLQFYTGNIITKQGTAGAKLDIVGNCIVGDDLEINGNNSDVNIKGNYFGYGFRDRDNDGIEDDSNELTLNLGFSPYTVAGAENEESSAIIVNGNGADLDMSGITRLVLGGRAYIDLDGSFAKNTYMTGESVSLKGNQHMYVVDDTEIEGSKVAGRNPILYSELQSLVGNELNSDDLMNNAYETLGLKDKPVIAKRINDDVFFYYKNEKPSGQTEYFVNEYKNKPVKRQELIDQAAKLGVVNLSINPTASIYSVGSVISVDTLLGKTEVTEPTYGEHGISEDKFKKILTSIDNRKKNLTPSLNDVSSLYILGEHDDIVDVVESSVSPYEYYVNREKLLSEFAGSRVTVELDLQNLDSTRTELSSSFAGQPGLSAEQQKSLKNQVLSILGNEYKTKKVGYAIICESGMGGSALELDAGVVVSECPCSINKNFKGLVLSESEIYITNNISIEAAAELAELLLTTCPQLRAVLNPEFQMTGVDETGSIVNVGSLKYTDIVNKTNWRKDS